MNNIWNRLGFLNAREFCSYLLRSAVILLLALCTLLPLAMMVLTSLKTGSEVSGMGFRLLPASPRFQNYVEVLTGSNWPLYILNSVIVTVLTTVISLVFNLLAGYAFARLRFPLRKPLFYSVLLGLMVPMQVNLVPVFILIKSVPLIGGNNLLGQGGTGAINTLLGIMLPSLAGAFGIFLARQFYLGFPRALDEAAKMDGAGAWRIFASIYLPLSKPLLASLGVIKITTVWNDYLWPLVITYSEGVRTVQLALGLYKDAMVRWELLMAAATIVVLPLAVVFLCAQRFFVEGIVTSGIKE
ncbi:carbohydrate ABC transporter permease [Harryflintia acetispora]|uniref:Multiple sugar transport system permease protein n=1 Tax=Harryflintia acetispora TaxID=1849041 RepID=A0A9X8UJD9_9FIRM|nr:carbohydrate ABC transporter permease [Harryflintia acetispora]TCL43462.1 multiple sugar transport system permease protein [Harryflintia acetispora]